MPIISVIVPVYKVEPYIHRCIDSILAQTYTDFELILIDDGSPDNCGEICDEYAAKDSRIHVIHQANGGLSAARNAGIDWAFANSDSEWLTFIDSDDYVSGDYLELLLYALVDSDADISVVCFEEFAEDGPKNQSARESGKFICSGRDACSFIYSDIKRMQHDELKHCSFVSACMKLFRKELFKQVRFPEGKIHEDQGTTYKVLYQASAVAVDSTIAYFYRNNPNSITRESFSLARYADLKFLKEAESYYQKKTICFWNSVQKKDTKY